MATEESACREWAGYVAVTGYGQTGRNTLAHRQAYEEHVGSIPEGMVVHHLCENKLCVNPEHMTLVTRAEHVVIHRRCESCPRCGGSRWRQNFYKGRPNGRRCMDCHARLQRERLERKQ